MSTILELQKTNCIHYCSVAGHLWFHSVKRNLSGKSNCTWIINDRELGRPVIKFFSVCPDHREPAPVRE